MIRIEITLGRGAAAPARLAASGLAASGLAGSGLAQASVTSSAPLPAAGPPAGVPRRSRQPAWQPVVASAAAALMFSFVATPDSPYAAAIDAATRAPVVAGSASAAASVAACAIPALAAPVPVAPLSTAVLADADAGLAMGEPLRADELDDAGRPSAADVAGVARATASAARALPTSAITPGAISAVPAVPMPHGPPAPADVASVPPAEPTPATRMTFSIERSISSGEEALINNVTALLGAGDWVGARAALHAHQWPGSVALAKLAARAALNAEAPTEAVAALTSLTAQLDSEGRRLLAAALMQAARPGEAVDIYRELLSITPGDATLWLGLAVALEAAGASRPAVVFAYQQARGLSSDARVRRFAELRLAALA